MGDQLAFAFATGMLATVNPCGFAMLPGFLGYYVGSGDGGAPARPLLLGLRAGAALSVGFAAVFTLSGLVLAAGLRFVIGSIPWVAVVIGAALVVLGLAQLFGSQVLGGRLRAAGSATRFLARGSGLRGVLGYGAAYAVAAVSCSLALLLAVVAQAVATGNLLALLAVFAAYALGSSVVLMLLAVSASFARDALVRRLRRLVPYAGKVGGGALALAGIYLLTYWVPALVGEAPGGTVGEQGAAASAAITGVVSQHTVTLSMIAAAVLATGLLTGLVTGLVRRARTNTAPTADATPGADTTGAGARTST